MTFSFSFKIHKVPPIDHVKKTSEIEGSKLKSNVWEAIKLSLRGYNFLMLSKKDNMFLFDILTPFGAPVVPEVNIRYAKSVF